jgi:ADP-ribose pyrophosphatase
VPFDEAFAAVSDGRIEDVKTALLLHWLAANKDKLL